MMSIVLQYHLCFNQYIEVISQGKCINTRVTFEHLVARLLVC